MDVKRLLLLIPLAVLAYLIVVQWNQDYGQVSPEPEAPSFTSSPANGEAQQADPDGLAVPATPSATGDVSQAMPGEVSSPTSSRDLIAVVTDVLDLRIDPQGGDVVYAALPQHKLTLNSDRPYVLLSDSESRSYVARSGLQLDGQAGRIAFTPEQTEYRLSEGEDRLEVDLRAEVNGVDVIKRFTFESGSYAVDVNYYLANNTEAPVTARFNGPIHCTRGTRDLLEIMLQDAAFIMAKDVEWENKWRKRQDKPLIEPLYELEDVERTLALCESHPYGQPVDLPGGARLVFRDAGHILGSAIVELTIPSGGQEERESWACAAASTLMTRPPPRRTCP